MKKLYSVISILMALFVTISVNAQAVEHNMSSTTDATLEVSNFEGKISSKAIEIVWTSNKLNIADYYEVEQSFDGINFKTAGMVLDGLIDEAGISNFKFKIKKSSVAARKKVYFRVKQRGLASAATSQVFAVNLSA